eukprot:303693-Amphidinium_carterae.1
MQSMSLWPLGAGRGVCGNVSVKNGACRSVSRSHFGSGHQLPWGWHGPQLLYAAVYFFRGSLSPPCWGESWGSRDGA